MSTKNVADFYPLSPMQQGMLFQSLLEPESGVYVEQVSCILHGPLEPELFRRAWAYVIERHAILRTGFVGGGLKEPVQVVQRAVETPLEVLDWTGENPEDGEALFEDLRTSERTRGFNLAVAPLLRVRLARAAPDTHYLVWTYHHILLDGWSVPILFREVFTAYEAYRGGQQPRLLQAPAFRDYIVWLRKQSMAEAEEYWRRILKGFAAPTPLLQPPAGLAEDAPDPLHRYRETEVWMTGEETAALQALARGTRITLNTVVQAAWAVLLSRYAGEDEALFGVTVSGRPPTLRGAEDAVGLFINTLPFRVPVPPLARIDRWLQEVQTAQLEMRQFEYTSLLQIEGWAETPRGMSLFESVLVYENYPVSASTSGGGSLRIEEVKSVEQANLPLALIAGADEGLLLRIAYDSQRFPPDAIDRMLGHLRSVLNGIARNPGGTLAQLSLLTPAEESEIAGWNATSSPLPAQTVFEMFEAWAERTPEAVAVVQVTPEARRSLCYRELNEQANRLAHALRGLGAGPDTLIGISMERSIERVVAVLGVLKAGAAYVPLDPEYPADRLDYMVRDSGMRLLMTEETVADRTPGGAQVRRLYPDEALLEGQPLANLARLPGFSLDSLVYCIYTSGSTGQPKGVLVPHLGLANFILANLRIFEELPGGPVLQFASFSFDASAAEMFTALAGGAPLYLARQDVLTSLPSLRGLIAENRISSAILPPSLLSVLDPEGLECLNAVFSAGERLPASVARKWAQGRRLFNAYGPTEASIGPTLGRVGEVPASATSASIGRPIPNMQVEILDRLGRRQPVGVPGELCLAGVGLARGYLGRPDLTAEKFIAAPDGRRLYRSGDLARYLPNGEIEVTGRIDHQVKVLGRRIELGEIEAALRGHGEVTDAVVTVMEQQNEDGVLQRLVGYVTPRTAPAAAVLRAFLRERLPEFMVPSVIVSLDALPLSPNGKIDRRALPRPNLDALAAHAGPASPTEEMLAGLWGQLLGLRQAGRDDSFFDLGGHSLLATQLATRIRDGIGVDLPLRVIFEAPVLADLAARIDAARRELQGTAAPPIVPVARTEPLPLSFAQLRLWFLDQLEPGSPFYNLPSAVRLAGPLDVGALRAALQHVVDRHEILRTRFITSGGEPFQEVLPVGSGPAQVALPLIDLADWDAEKRAAEVARCVAEEAKRPFDLATGRLLRCCLIRTGAEEHVLLLNLHHIVADGWSAGIFVREVAVLYGALAVRGSSLEAPPADLLPPLPVQYADFAVWQRRWLQGTVSDAQADYWRKELDGAPELLDLPLDRPRPPVQTYRGATFNFELERELTGDLTGFARREGATLFMTLLAAFQALLHRYSGQDDIPVGTPIANRTRRETERLIGFFVNTLVLRGRLGDNPTFTQLVRRTRETALGAYAHQDLPFETLVDTLQPQRSMSHSPLFQVFFTLQEARAGGANAPGLSMSPLEADAGVAKFDLTLSVTAGDGELGAAFEYSTDLFDAGTIERMAGHFQTLLKDAVARPGAHIGELGLLTPPELAQFAAWNGTATPLSDRTVVDEFNRRVEETPGAPAVVFVDQQASGRERRIELTYAELDRRAEALARRLRSLGVGSETITGIAVDRSPAMVVAVLGVLRAGGAYLPLDPAYPADRLAYMLEDSGARLVVVQAETASRLPALAGFSCVEISEEGILAPDLTPGEEIADPRPTPGSLCYVIYTSGSTGRPKGVLAHHRGLANLVRGQVEETGVDSTHRVLQFASFSFDACASELFMALSTGATLYLTPASTLTSPPDFIALMQREAITTITLPPSFLALLDPTAFPALRVVLSAGERLPLDVAKKWAGENPERPGPALFNAYGPTEASIGPTLGRVPSSVRGVSSASIGRPLRNIEIDLCDRYGNLVPVGVPGEIFVAGAGVTRGYLNRPDLTAERFVPRTQGRTPGERAYRTADLARYLPDGQLEVLGRTDQQVKLRGFRIELGEIEAALRLHEGIAEAAALVREDQGGNRRLVAYLVPREGQSDRDLDAGALREFLRRRLPEYMIPAAFVSLSALPLTANGKLDRKALRAPDAGETAKDDGFVPPTTPQEEELAEIWERLLHVERVGVEDNFFDLGGDSILSIQMVARAQQAGITLTPRQLFLNPTIRGLLQSVRAETPVQAEQGEVTGPVILSPMQRWYFQHHTEAPHHWNTSLLLALPLPLGKALLQQALASLLQHHDALRLRFVRSDSGEWTATGSPWNGETGLEWQDLSALTEAEQPAAVERLAAAAQRSLDLASGPLLRTVYMDLGENPHRLLFVFHHLVVDGVSVRVFIEDFGKTYLRLTEGLSPDLGPKSTSFKEWTARLDEYAQSDRLAGELPYWAALADGAWLHIPQDFPGGRNSYGDSAEVTLSLTSEETTELLQRTAKTLGASVAAILTTALATILVRWSGGPGRGVLLETEGHGREDWLFPGVDLTSTMGWFTCRYPLGLALPGSDDLSKAVQSVAEQMQKVPQHGMGFDLLRYLRRDRRGLDPLDRIPAPEVNFNYLGQFDQETEESIPFWTAPEPAGPEQHEDTQRGALLYVVAIISGGELQVRWSYSPGLHTGETIETRAQDMLALLRRIITAARAGNGHTGSLLTMPVR